jgi:cellulose synthase/poly-beta-1,6-N-acetylglucosamine synthase-like glycosyltransferase
MQILFWLIVASIFWTYLGYPCLLAVLARFSQRKLISAPIEPSVTVIISAYNEQKHIGQKLANTRSLDYPPDKLEIIVASDCSTDQTHDIVRQFQDQSVKLVILPQRGGKTAAQNSAVAEAQGEILVFTDATTLLQRDAIRQLVKGFADPRIGCIDAPHESLSEEGTIVGRGGSTYRYYETKIKVLEARVNSLIGVTGCLYAMRRSLYRPLHPDLISDFVIASMVYAQGCVSVSSNEVMTREITHEDPAREFEMRVRVVVRSINGLVHEARMLNPFRYGFFSVQLLSHKVLRYLVPESLLFAFILCLILAFSHTRLSGLYQLLSAIQIALYATALLGWLCLRFKIRAPLLHIPFYFILANLAALWGSVRYLSGDRMVTWNTAR